MDPVGKALWFIESHFAGEITLEEIAAVSGVSRYHLSRAFGAAFERPVMRYVRGRRLSEAAKVLASGATDILTVALDAGYGSHEAFTRAFRDQFGVTPETVRAQRRCDGIELVDPIKMDKTLLADVKPGRFVTGKPLLIAGLSARYNCESTAGIPAQWQRFVPYIGHVAGQVGRVAYGVRCNADEAGHMDYVCGVEVTDFSELPPELTGLRIAAQKYAVFTHADHVSTIRCSWHSIFSGWLPSSGYELVDAPDFERYGEDFNPMRGTGGIEIWIPVKA
jgi:AraC family transcriptional regulator